MCKLGVHREQMDVTIHVWLEGVLHLPLWALPGHGLGGRVLGYRDWRLGMDLASGN